MQLIPILNFAVECAFEKFQENQEWQQLDDVNLYVY
jgi:hypothetical protein